MPPAEYQRFVFRDKFRSLHSGAFQTWLEDLLQAIHTIPVGNFQAIRNTQGDGGLDGLVINSGLAYAIYAPTRRDGDSDSKTAAKIYSDFAKASSTLSGSLNAWSFVHNHPEGKLGKLGAAAISDLKSRNPLVDITVLNADSLWEKLKALPAETLERFFGAPATVRWPGERNVYNGVELEGRAGDVAKLVRLLTRRKKANRVLVFGHAGVGKSALTKQAASSPEVVDLFHDRRCFVPLANASDAGGMIQSLVGALGLPPLVDREGILAELEREPALIVLDNLETPLDSPDAERVGLVLNALAGVNGIAMLASSQPSALASGIDWRLFEIDRLRSPYDQKLFLKLAYKIRQDDKHLKDFLGELGGLPLAIELVANRAKGYGDLNDLWKRWRKMGTALAVRKGKHGGRLDSLDRSFELALRAPRIGKEGRRLFCLLGQLAGGIADDDRHVLLGTASGDAAEQLIGASLAQHAGGRIDVLPPVRRFARDHYLPGNSDARKWRRHYLQLVREHGSSIQRSGGATALARLGPEISNIAAAINAVITGNLKKEVDSKFLNCYRRLLSATGQGSVEAFRQIAALYGPKQHSQKAFALWCYGNVIFRRSQFAAAQRAYEEALNLYPFACAKSRAHCLRNLADCALARGDHKSARDRFDEALRTFTNLTVDKDLAGVANCYRGQGDTEMEGKNFVLARDRYSRALVLFQDMQLNDFVGQGNCTLGFAEISLQTGSLEEAEKYYQRAANMYGDTPLGKANCIRGFGDVARSRGQRESAFDQYREAFEIYRNIGNVVGQATCSIATGDLQRGLGNGKGARDSYVRALDLSESVGDLSRVGQSHWRLGQVGSDKAVRKSHLEKAAVAWGEIGREDLIALLNSADEENIATYRSRVA